MVFHFYEHISVVAIQPDSSQTRYYMIRKVNSLNKYIVQNYFSFVAQSHKLSIVIIFKKMF